ncbi:4Fe-4S binding protein [Lutibacter sp. B2]|nr:4Fe-4S binding protein [Lutibacter sp. B2]
MKRKIIKIHEEKCNGCRLCVEACHEGAIQMVEGKAKLISDQYCDGLGDCLPGCPTGAIEIIEREADEYSQEAVDQLAKEKKAKKQEENLPCGCPGTFAKKIEKKAGGCPGNKAQKINNDSDKENESKMNIKSELSQWPVQLKLVNPNADYFENADLLIAADCTAFAYGNFHQDFIKNKITVIGCPKLDDNDYYAEKIGSMLSNNHIKSITVIRMEVPCCTGIVNMVKKAMLKTETIVPYNEVVIGIDGTIK